jgi:hypothetical protein
MLDDNVKDWKSLVQQFIGVALLPSGRRDFYNVADCNVNRPRMSINPGAGAIGVRSHNPLSSILTRRTRKSSSERFRESTALMKSAYLNSSTSPSSARSSSMLIL